MRFENRPEEEDDGYDGDDNDDNDEDGVKNDGVISTGVEDG